MQVANGIVTQNFGGDETCVVSAISIARLALGYKPAVPRWAMASGKVGIDWILENAGRFFPKHKVHTSTRTTSLLKKAHNPLHPEEIDIGRGRYLWLFAYTTFSEIGKQFLASEVSQTHLVIGLPVSYDGMAIAYLIRVTLDDKPGS